MTQLVSFFKIILYPFELLLSAIFSFLFSFTDSYGISLILLSFFITIITAPLYYLAEKWRNEEKAIQKRMSRDIEKIKKTFTGNKRFYQIRAAHKIYNYKSWQTFKTSFGLLVQIPFFFAAYSLLSNYKGYTGVPFFIIKDLAKPDNLLWGLNLLPFVMTFVNIAASIYYTKSLRFKENSQLFVMAIIFLLLLYKSPSALLIYWTMNNIFSLAKNIMLRNTGILPPPILSEKT